MNQPADDPNRIGWGEVLWNFYTFHVKLDFIYFLVWAACRLLLGLVRLVVQLLN